MERRRARPPFPPAPRRAESIAPPRLVLRFALYTAVGLALAAAGILLFIRQHGIAQAEHSVAFHARFVADSVLSDQLRTNDFAQPVRGQRRAALDQLFRSEVLVGSTLGATLYGPNGRVTYSTDHALIGRASRPPAPGMETSVQEWGGTKALNVYVPLRVGRGDEAGTFALHQDYGPIAASARKAFIPVAGVLELALLGLYLSLFPLLRRVTRRLRGHLDEIEHQALHDGLTGLPNRDLFRRRIDEALAEAATASYRGSVMLLDLDHFKEINDTLGHQSGDLLLQALAKRLRDRSFATRIPWRAWAGTSSLVATRRWDEAGALVLAERIRAGLEAPFAARRI